MAQALERAWQGTAGGTHILPFTLAPECPRCLWCRHPFVPSKPNQRYCKAKHRQRACERRKAALVPALAAFLEGQGMAQKRALAASADVVEAYYATGRIQRAVEALGWMYNDVTKTWMGRSA